MYRVALSCAGLTEGEGSGAPKDILDEFAQRPWHTKVGCTFDGTLLRLTAENDFDATGEALLDEFGDAIHAGK